MFEILASCFAFRCSASLNMTANMQLPRSFLGRREICICTFLFGPSHELDLFLVEKSDCASIEAVIAADYLYLSGIHFGLENRRR